MNFPKIKTINNLIIINVVSYFIFLILSNFINYIYPCTDILNNIFLLNSGIIKTILTPWSLITYSFLHSSIMHLLSNMILFYFISISFVDIFSERQLLSFYIVSSIFIGILNILILNIFSIDNYVLGASGVVFGLFAAVGYMKPNMIVNLFSIIKIKMKWLVLFFIILEFSRLSLSSIGHLSGVVFGLLFTYYYNKNIDITSFSDKYLNFFYKKNIVNIVKNKPIISKLNTDDILDKINRKGLKSLNKDELNHLKK